MMRKYLPIYFLLIFLSCTESFKKAELKKSERPSITKLGVEILFPKDSVSISFLKDTLAIIQNLKAELKAPAKVVANVIRNINNKSYNMVMFSDQNLSANFSSYLERTTNINTYKLNLKRAEELYENGAATGREVLEAKAALQNEEAALLENETQFLQAGLEPEDIFSHEVGTVWVICEINENDIDKIITGKNCKVKARAYEDETFTGLVEDIADYVDNVTRMVKLRIELHNTKNKLKAGMFVTVEFGLTEGSYLCVPTSSLTTVQGKDYVFVRKSTFEFERRAVSTGQQFGDKTVIFKGIAANERVVTEGVVQLKGLSFGY